MRVAVEPLVVTQLARVITQPTLDELHRLVDAMDESLAIPYNEAKYIELNEEFHRTAYEAAAKGYVWESLQKTGCSFRRCCNMGVLFGYTKPSTEPFRKVLGFLENGGENRVEVATAIHEYLSNYATYIEQLISDFPDCFVNVNTTASTRR